MPRPTWADKLPWKEIRLAAHEHSLDANLVAAIIQVESGGDNWAARYEPKWAYQYHPHQFAQANGITHDTELMLQRFSFGLMQVMGTVARELGHHGPLTALCLPEVGLHYGCKKFRQQLDRYNGNDESAVAAYNAGSVVLTSAGFYKNVRYVDKVYGYYREVSALD